MAPSSHLVRIFFLPVSSIIFPLQPTRIFASKSFRFVHLFNGEKPIKEREAKVRRNGNDKTTGNTTTMGMMQM